MIQKCKYDPITDVEAAVPDLSVDVAEVMATHQVPSSGNSAPYSKETDVNEVGHYLTDKIQTAITAMRLSSSLGNAAGQKGKASQTPAAGAASE